MSLKLGKAGSAGSDTLRGALTDTRRGGQQAVLVFGLPVAGDFQMRGQSCAEKGLL